MKTEKKKNWSEVQQCPRLMLKSSTGLWSSQHLFFSINCLTALLSTLAIEKIIEHLLRNWKFSKLEGTYTREKKEGFCHKFFCSLYSLPFSSKYKSQIYHFDSCLSHRLNHTEKETGEHKKLLFRNY